jgi:hypothetical protein
LGLLMTSFIELLLTGCVWMRLLIHGDVVMGRPDDVSSRHFAAVSPDKVKEGVLLLGGRGSHSGLSALMGLTGGLTIEFPPGGNGGEPALAYLE